MKLSLEQVEAAALALPAEERERLADRIVRSLGEEPVAKESVPAERRPGRVVRRRATSGVADTATAVADHPHDFLEGDPCTPEEAEEWALEEVERRHQEHLAGCAELIPMEVALARTRAQLHGS